MKYFSLIAAGMFFIFSLQAQDKTVMAFPITDYIIEKDSVTIVQVVLPEGIEVREKAVGILKKVYTSTDTAVSIVASGRCQLIKGNYLYFGLLKKDIKQQPVAGNLIYVFAEAPGKYAGSLFQVICYGIVLQNVEGIPLATMSNVLALKGREEEMAVIEQLAEDVRYTGTEMAKQGGADMPILTGHYKGKSIFAAMQAVTGTEVEKFLKYIHARPEKYAGNSWKFCEIMATWMMAGAPAAGE